RKSSSNSNATAARLAPKSRPLSRANPAKSRSSTSKSSRYRKEFRARRADVHSLLKKFSVASHETYSRRSAVSHSVRNRFVRCGRRRGNCVLFMIFVMAEEDGEVQHRQHHGFSRTDDGNGRKRCDSDS